MADEGLRSIKTHAWLMYAVFGCLLPLGILTVRLMQLVRKRYGPHHPLSRALFYVHQFFQISATCVLIAGIAYSFKHFGINTKHTHQRLGLSLWGMVLVQVLLSIYRPSIGTRHRVHWYFLHWLMGTTSVILGYYNIFVGINIWELITQTSIKKLNIYFSLNVALTTLFYLLGDRIENLIIQLYGLPQKKRSRMPSNEIV